MGLIKVIVENDLADLGRLKPDIVGYEQIVAMIEGFELDQIATAPVFPSRPWNDWHESLPTLKKAFVTAEPAYRWLSLVVCAYGSSWY